MRIDVTQEHIDKGGPRIRCCPIALALLASGIEDPAVFGPDFRHGPMLKRKEVALPEVAARFVRDFDNRQPVKPFHFDIEVQS